MLSAACLHGGKATQKIHWGMLLSSAGRTATGRASPKGGATLSCRALSVQVVRRLSAESGQPVWTSLAFVLAWSKALHAMQGNISADAPVGNHGRQVHYEGVAGGRGWRLGLGALAPLWWEGFLWA